MDNLLLDGKVAWVTGAGRGLGAAIAQAIPSLEAVRAVRELDVCGSAVTDCMLAEAFSTGAMKR